MAGGKLFQTRGPATANALSPSDVVIELVVVVVIVVVVVVVISRAPSVSCATRLMLSICLFIFLSGNIFRTAEPISTKVCTVTATG